MSDGKGYVISTDDKGSIHVSEDVLAVIAANAAAEVSGVSGPFVAQAREGSGILGRKGTPKGVKINLEGDSITIDINTIVHMGFSVSEVGADVQKAVITAIEGTTGITPAAVNVSICGISLNKDNG